MKVYKRKHVRLWDVIKRHPGIPKGEKKTLLRFIETIEELYPTAMKRFDNTENKLYVVIPFQTYTRPGALVRAANEARKKYKLNPNFDIQVISDLYLYVETLYSPQLTFNAKMAIMTAFYNTTHPDVFLKWSELTNIISYNFRSYNAY